MVSVILPFFNAEENLEESIQGIIGQDFQNLELILIDDVSSDDSLEIARDMAARDPRIRILRHKRNQGPGLSRNTGVENAAGKYIFFMDSDDILLPGALDLLYETLVREKVRVVIGSCNQVDEKGVVSDHDRTRDLGCEDCFGLIDGDDAVRRWLNIEEGNFLPVRPWGILIEAGMYRNSGLTFSSGEHEDLTWTPFLYKSAGKVFYLKDIVVTYRIRPGSIINSSFSVERVRRYHGVWDDTLKRMELYGLQKFHRDFKIFHVGNLLWQLNLSPSSREVLEAVSEVLERGLNLKEEKRSGRRGRDLGYMPEMISRILKHSGFNDDFRIWTKLVAGFGDDILFSFVKRKLFQIREMIWRIQMIEDSDREELLRLKSRLAEAETMNEQMDHQISGLESENERLRKRLVEVSFYLNSLLSDMDKRIVASNKRVRGSRRFGMEIFRPSVLIRFIKRMPGIRVVWESGIVRALEKSGHFSPEYYRETYNDLSDYKGDLLLHFVRYGGYEGRSPNRYFDSKWYLNSNPVVEKKGINPLYHYLKFGMKAGLWPSPDYSPEEYGDMVLKNMD
jgi:glycosyltransferase involved in cell wall biosynthesis